MNNDYQAGFKAGFRASYESPDYVDFCIIVHGAKNLARHRYTVQLTLINYLTSTDNDGFLYCAKTGILVVYFRVGVIILLPNKVLQIVYTCK